MYNRATVTIDHITLLCYDSAAGIDHPLMIIYSYSIDLISLMMYFMLNLIQGGYIWSSFSLGSMKYAVPQRPILLLNDGYKLHITLHVKD